MLLQHKTLFGQLQRLLRITVDDPLITKSSAPVECVLAVVQTCNMITHSTSSGPDALFTIVSTDGAFRGTTIIDANDVLAVAARVVDRGEEFFVEQAGSVDFFKNPQHAELLDDA